MKRRENDNRIKALHVEMKNMITVLIQYVRALFVPVTASLSALRLKNVKDVAEVAPDGTTVEGRMQDLAKVTAGDIKDCANACDTYSKKKLIGSSNSPYSYSLLSHPNTPCYSESHQRAHLGIQIARLCRSFH